MTQDEQEQEQVEEQKLDESIEIPEDINLEPAQEPAPEPTPEEQIATLNDQLLRALAEIENTRRRAERERSEALKYGAAALARDILSVGDNLTRSLAAIAAAEINDPAISVLIEGVEATERELQAVLARHNIKIINPLGEKFDPNQHEALFEAPDESKEPGTITEVIEIGYMLNDRLLRAAKVGIIKK